jgi:hypothetical protein
LITNDPNVNAIHLLFVLLVIIQPATAAVITGHHSVASFVRQKGCDV